MKVFVDTSALYALASSSDANHQAAVARYKQLQAEGCGLITSNYVVVESLALVQRRLGLDVARRLSEALDAGFQTVWIDEDQHRSAWKLVKQLDRRHLSLVDCVSFEVMKTSGLRKAFAFDAHFSEHGYELYS